MHHKLKVLDLFSGIGGFSLGLERAGMETVAFCEIEDYPRKVLKKHWPDVPIYEDIRELTSERLEADGITADLICGGYPCQPFSTAGKRQGEGDDRHLWPEMYRLIKTLRPRWVIAENVAGHISMGLDAVLSDLEAEDYAWWPFVIPACAVDAKHRRDRIWIIANDAERINGTHHTEQTERQEQEFGESISGKIVANASGGRCGAKKERENKQQRGAKIKRGSEVMADTSGARSRQDPRSIHENEEEHERRAEKYDYISKCSGEDVADPNSNHAQGKFGECNDTKNGSIPGERQAGFCGGTGNWKPEPPVGRVANGIPRRVDRLRGLGNAVVPQIPEIIGRAIMEIENAP